MVNAASRPLYPRERDPGPIVKEARWAPEPVWTGAKNRVNEDNYGTVNEDGRLSGRQLRPRLAGTFGPELSYGRRLLALQCPGLKLSLVEVKRQDGIKRDSWNVITTSMVIETVQSL